MSDKNSCRKCGSFDLEIDPCRGETVCTNCGMVIEESVIVSEVQFEENAHGGSSAIGQFVSSESSRGNMTVIGSYSYGLQKESKEITIQKAKNELSRMCQLLRINSHCLKEALGYYTMALNQHLTKGRRTSLVCAACLYIVCRREKTPHLLIDFSDVLLVDPFALGRTFAFFAQKFYLELPSIDPCIYVLRFANQMKLGDKTHEVCATALRILRRMKRDFLHCGRRPSGLCGSALILAARFHNIPTKLKDIVKVVHIQEVTLRKRLMEFGDTPSSSLTTDEFLTVDLGEEQDPPSFKMARIKDKERLQKYTDLEYEMKMKKLQRLIEKELEKKRIRGKRSLSMCSFDSDSETNSVSPAKPSETILKDIIENNLDDDKEINDAVAKTTVESISDMCSNLKDDHYEVRDTNTKELGPTLETMGINSNNSTSKTDDGKDKGTTSENSTNDDNGNEYSLDGLDDEELDSYIVTEDEFVQKQKAWTELYAEYLEEQKRKEEERLAREKEEGKSENKKKKRQRKSKSGGAATAGEAIEKVLREKKISNKLNYDVLKSLNVDDFVKSMNFGSLNSTSNISGSEITVVEDIEQTNANIKEDQLLNTNEKRKRSDDMNDDDDYDEADYEDQEVEENNVLRISDLLRGNDNEDDDYEDYDF